jgi:hypothetical protein
MIRDKNIDYRYASHYLPAKDFSGCGLLSIAATTAPSSLSLDQGPPVAIPAGTTWPITVGTKDIIGAADALPVREVGALATLGVLFSNDGEFMRHFMPLPTGVDYANDIYMRVVWSSSSSTATDSILWRIKYDLGSWNNVIAQGTLAGTALDTAIVTDTKGVATANIMQATTWGKINAGTINPSTKDWIVLDLNYQTETGLTSCLAHGVQFLYIPKFSRDNEKHRARAAAPTNA